jgi:methionyl-tRNA formyltransferase
MQPESSVLLCTSGGYFGSLVLQRLLDSPHCRVVGVVQSSRILRPGYGWLQGAMRQVQLSGLRYAWYLWCATALADVLCRLGRQQSIAQLISRHDVPLLVTSDINDAAGQDFLRRVRPELLICAFFNQRLEEHTYSAPSRGAVNIHPSLLPKDKGVDPVFFGRLRGATRYGVTLHRIVSALDAGAVLAQREIAPDPRDSVFRLTAALFQAGAELLMTQLDAILEGAVGHEQDRGGNYDSWPTAAQVKALRLDGVALVRVGDLFDLWRGRLLPESPH